MFKKIVGYIVIIILFVGTICGIVFGLKFKNLNDKYQNSSNAGCEEIKDFKFSGNKITGYTGTEVNLKTLPSSYSINIGEVKEVVEITVDDMSDEEAMKEFSEKVENN